MKELKKTNKAMVADMLRRSSPKEYLKWLRKHSPMKNLLTYIFGGIIMFFMGKMVFWSLFLRESGNNISSD